ncbi:MAG: fatty acid oxidation complex subunit alpha FadJ, partial [Myxococcales bacterium]|nr:fatty acid oxidation complex subunit alpha FadJ [Myxococcales bacterium]
MTKARTRKSTNGNGATKNGTAKNGAAKNGANGHGKNGHGAAAGLTVEKRKDGVAVVWFDIPGEPVNTLKATFADDFDRAFSEVENDGEVTAVVLASKKKDNFIAGADITMLQLAKTAKDAEALSERGQRAMDRIAGLKKPVVAAIHGACLGGGLETALACHARVASEHPKTKLGLPEVQLGVLPGAGGTQRLPALIGVQAALDLMLTGKQVDAKKAKKLGLVDEVVHPAIVVEAAAAQALALARGPRAKSASPFDRLKHLLDRDELQERALTDNPLGRKVLFDQAHKQLFGKTRGNYPAPERILDVVRAGLEKGMTGGLRAEREAFGELVISPVARQLMNIFFATQALKKDTGVTRRNVKPLKVQKVGVLGAGLMGAGVAYVTATGAKTPVRIKDKDHDGILRGLASIREIVDERVTRRRMSRFEGDRLMSMMTGTTDLSGFQNADVVIEAVFEDLDLKHKVLRETEAVLADHAIFASNTSSIPITKIASASRRPENVIGMHYFSPVHKMPLLEIIVTPKTAPEVTVTAVELGKRQGKTVIVVNDGVGFYTTRILAPFMNEAAHLLAEGVPIPAIDKALMDYGYPVGPIKLTDEVGIDVGAKVGKIMLTAFGERMTPPAGMEKLIADQRFGRKNKRGFYRYDDPAKKREVDESVYKVLGVSPTTKMDPLAIAERCTLQMVNEAARCLEEGILRSPRDGDIGAIFGLGFPPFRGG